jgi:hypothetical protein
MKHKSGLLLLLFYFITIIACHMTFALGRHFNKNWTECKLLVKHLSIVV